MRLLLVEDTERLRQLLIESIHVAGWRVDAFARADDAAEACAVLPYDLILVDLGLPDGDGLDLIRRLRRSGVKAPVLVITARAAVGDRIEGLDAGADDYLVKPFNHGELLARCRALLRRSPAVQMPVLEVGALAFDVAAGSATCQGRDLGLAPRERTVLEVVMREAGRVVPKRRLEHALSEFGEEVSANAVEIAISRLRRKLEALPTGTALETVRGVGYLLRETETR